MDLNPNLSACDPQPPGGWPRPRSAYVHVPFCRHRCGYCNFSVVANRDDLIERFLGAIDVELARLQRPPLQTVFIGGGTPTHLDPGQLQRLLSLISERFELAPGYEWSVEANPEDITPEKLGILSDHGVNRISLGVQSFQDQKLRLLERGHRGGSVDRTIEQVAARIPNVSLDLIFAAPGETLEQWRGDLRTALGLPITHLSTYALTFEKGTSFWIRKHRGDLESAGESLELSMYELARELTAAAGLDHYEISNFARGGFRCRHNLAYWDGRGWYAAGPGAARFVAGRREVNHRSTTTYLRRVESEQSPVSESEPLSLQQYARERAAFGIRMIDGIELDAISAETGVDLRSLCAAAISQSVQQGLLQEIGGRMRLSERGILFADTVASRLL